MLTVSPLIDPNHAVGTFRCPDLPQLNEFYGREAHFDYSKARIEDEGLGIVIRLDESNLRLRGIPPFMLAAKVFGLAGIETKQSNAGKVALRVIQQMGGIDNCRAFKIAGVRDLLHVFTPTKHFSHSQASARIGANFTRYKQLFIEPRPHREDLTPQGVFLHLVKKEVFRPGIELECTNCLLTDWHSLSNLDEKVACAYCGFLFDCASQLRDGAWQYRVSGVFARSQDHEGAIPVTLALMQTLRILHHGMIWLTGTDLSWLGLPKPAETDFVVIAENYDKVPQVLIGECKTNMQITAEQFDKLLAVARKFKNTGIKVFILLAKAGVAFSKEELQMIDDRQTIALNFILLTARELEPYEPYENVEHPNVRHRRPLTLEEWAEVSRKLYLTTSPEEVLQRHVKAKRVATARDLVPDFARPSK